MDKAASSCVQGENYRITLLTPQLIRMEYAPDGVFEDRPTKMALNRDFPAVEYRCWRTERGLEIQTDFINLYYDEQPFSPNGLWAENRSDCHGIFSTWHYGDKMPENLGGTTRTLDEVDGATTLSDGILSRLCGYSVLDDSVSPVLTEDGWFTARKEGIQDLYLFCYGLDYKKALRDFFALCGKTPLLPRFALGNWWSRYHAYTQQEYERLMDDFEEKQVPLSVAVIDMDWHITEPGQGGKGWTGYTWNKELFPDPEAFLKGLHDRGLKTTLNLHPAEGIQAHEDAYPSVAAALGRDAGRGQRIPFDPTDRKFMEAYFELVHKPLEEMGVDFWWIDWQQGTNCAAANIDPLWVLNHYHTRFAGRDGKRALILSRYGGPGSHRYPLGFSGDTAITWESLDFQPYFTATASNIGYGWWSHDIGGHMRGVRDNELQVRWVQYGVFSPIMRLHSTNNRFNGKEPWRYPPAIEEIMAKAMRLRHRLVPYLYAMNLRCHRDGEMLAQPMYYTCPDQDAAYRVPNEYWFGSELIVLPITAPQSRELQLGSVKGWLPEGEYTDIFTGLRYRGGREVRLYRALEQIPVLAKAGAILPLAGDEDENVGTGNPEKMEIRVFPGADGQFDLYEDDGETMAFEQGAGSHTDLRFDWNGGRDCAFTLAPGQAADYLPEKRTFLITLEGVKRGETPKTLVDGKPYEAETAYQADRCRWTVRLRDVPQQSAIRVVFPGDTVLCGPDALTVQEKRLNDAQIGYELKDKIYGILEKRQPDALQRLQMLDLPEGLLNALTEPMWLSY